MTQIILRVERKEFSLGITSMMMFVPCLRGSAAGTKRKI